MTIKMNPQLKLPLGLSEPDWSLDDTTQAQLIKELANLIFRFGNKVNDTNNTSKEQTDE